MDSTNDDSITNDLTNYWQRKLNKFLNDDEFIIGSTNDKNVLKYESF